VALALCCVQSPLRWESSVDAWSSLKSLSARIRPAGASLRRPYWQIVCQTHCHLTPIIGSSDINVKMVLTEFQVWQASSANNITQ
jgi:hypothetical protein